MDPKLSRELARVLNEHLMDERLPALRVAIGWCRGDLSRLSPRYSRLLQSWGIPSTYF